MEDTTEKYISELIKEMKCHVKEMKRLISSDFTKELFGECIEEYLPEVESFIEKTTGNASSNINISHSLDWLDELFRFKSIPHLDYHNKLSLIFTSDNVTISFLIKGEEKKKFIDKFNSYLYKFQDLKKAVSDAENERRNSIMTELTIP